MSTEANQEKSPIVPLEYAGRWIAWNHEGTRIIASGRTFQEVKDAAALVGEVDPILEKAPKADVRFVGVLSHAPTFPRLVV